MSRRRTIGLAAAAACLTAAVSGCSISGTPVTAVAPADSATADTGLPRPDHVVIVMLENKDEADVRREAPYLRSLAQTGSAFTDMHAETHPSQPNYIALFSGGTQGIDNDDCPHTIDAPNLASELTAAGFTFTGYAEDLPEAGYTGCEAGDYARKHSPWTNFSDVPASANQPLSAMPTDFTQLPTVSFVIPNLCHDMHDCSIGEGDTWLRQNIDGYAQWARTNNSLLIVSFDESDVPDDSDNQISTIAVGQMVEPGTYDERADHYDLLRTLEDMYGLPALGRSADAAPLTTLLRSGT
jgi:hypothetical protein